LTGIIGIRWLADQTSDRALAKFSPTQRAGSSPGPYVTAIASIFGFCIVGINFKNCSSNSGSLSRILLIFLILD